MAVKTGVVFTSNLKDVIKMVTKVSEDRMKEATNHYRNALIDAVKTGTRSGISYPVPSRSRTRLASGRAAPRKNPRRYTASAPGEIPAVASGQLVKSIRSMVKKGYDLYGVVGSTVQHAVHLEYGTFKMKPRPFFWPVYKKNRAAIQAILSRRWF